MKIIIAMAGRGKRFTENGYELYPKPLCRVGCTTMIHESVRSFGVPGKYIFIVLQEHLDNFTWLYDHLMALAEDVLIIPIQHVTEGAACSILAARDYIYDNDPIVSINSDQVLNWNHQKFIDLCRNNSDTSFLVTYPHDHPKHSFAEVTDKNLVISVAEKKVISNEATVGIYHFSQGKIFVDCAEEMIKNNDRHNNEFYVGPVYNYVCKKYPVKIFRMHPREFMPVGTVEDLNQYNMKYYDG
tara:strand:- start:2863 stop:3588 length:726 start_codon:yes stop_codon:yes gene_type:complete